MVSKPNRHSKTPQIQRLINGEITPYFFARWDNNDLGFHFRVGKLLNFQNIISKSYIKNRSSKTVRFEHNCKFFIDNIAIEEKVTSIDIDDIEVSSSEGRRIKSHHFRIERDPLIVKKKRENALNKDGKLECEVCSFDFKKFYGRRGDGFIECHHVNPVSEMQEDDETRLDDLALICSNCHRMIHRKEKTSEDGHKHLKLNKL